MGYVQTDLNVDLNLNFDIVDYSTFISIPIPPAPPLPPQLLFHQSIVPQQTIKETSFDCLPMEVKRNLACKFVIQCKITFDYHNTRFIFLDNRSYFQVPHDERSEIRGIGQSSVFKRMHVQAIDSELHAELCRFLLQAVFRADFPIRQHFPHLSGHQHQYGQL